jgi:hypothetical protein
MRKHNYIAFYHNQLMSVVHLLLYFLPKLTLFISALFILRISEVKAKDNYASERGNPELIYDEIPVLVSLQGISNFYVDVLYTDNGHLFVNIEDLFNNLKISYNGEQNGKIYTGFIENENRKYVIDYSSMKIIVGERLFDAQNVMIRESGKIYLESSILSDAFGININFNYRSLSIVLKSDFELPVLKIDRIERMRHNINRINGEIMPDTIMKRDYHLFRMGNLDWATSSYQTWNDKIHSQFNLGLGAELLYGEADFAVNYYENIKFDANQLQYLWKWVDNDNSIIKQAQVGRIYNQTISFINAPVIGAVVRNTPTTIRKAKGYYTISELTEPNWTVELYLNDVLVDYTIADASGLFVFKVPLVYGYTTVKLKFYGTLGEERTEERVMNTPYTVLPKNEFEYTLAGGILQDSLNSRFGKGEFSYGINRFLTAAGGIEYLSSITGRPFIPYAKFTFQPISKLLISGEYAHSVRTRILVDYYLFQNALFEIDYSKYNKGQLATRFNAPEERKFKLSVPFKIKDVNGFFKADFTQLRYSDFTFNQSGVSVSSHIGHFSFNSTTNLNWLDTRNLYATTDFSMSYKTSKGLTFRPSLRYNITEKTFLTAKAETEVRIPYGSVSLSFERNVFYRENLVNLNFRYDLPFARTSFSASRNKRNLYTSQSLQGSVSFSGGRKHILAGNVPVVGKGGITVFAFLDTNYNDKFDKGEQILKHLNVKINGGRVTYSKMDSITRVVGLEPFITYIMEVNENQFDNISWQLRKKIYQVVVDPNQFKQIEIPVIPTAEVTGMVSFKNGKKESGLGRIIVGIYNNQGIKVAETLTESDGYFYQMGLVPGEYYLRLDSLQLTLIDAKVNFEILPFTLKASDEGDIASNLIFSLIGKESTQNIDQSDSKSSPLISQSNNDLIIQTSSHEGKSVVHGGPRNVIDEESQTGISQDSIRSEGHLYYIQAGSFKSGQKASDMMSKLRKTLPYAVVVVDESGMKKVRIGYFKTRNDAQLCRKLLSKSGIDTFIGKGKEITYWGTLDLNATPYFIQAGAFRNEVYAIRYAQSLSERYGSTYGITIEDGYYKVRFGYFKTKLEMNSAFDQISNSGIPRFTGLVSH